MSGWLAESTETFVCGLIYPTSDSDPSRDPERLQALELSCLVVSNTSIIVVLQMPARSSRRAACMHEGASTSFGAAQMA